MSRAVLLVAGLAACSGGRDARPPSVPGPVKLAAAITASISARLGAAVVTHCPWPLPACFTRLPDGTGLVERVTESGAAWTWRVDGMLVTAAPIEAYVRGALDDLGAPVGAVHCGPALRVARAGERIACQLATGGAAWVTVQADGAMSLELALDPAAAAARGEIVAPAGDRELARQSHALEHSDDDEH